jgi:2-dehydropantoate 2-reductase
VTTKIAVVGIGAIGGAIAADLADVGRHEVQLCTRTPFDELEVTHSTGTSRVDARVVCDPNGALPVDWVLLATKAYQSPGAVPWLKKLCTPKTVVAVLQNGVDHEERIAPLLESGSEVLPVVVQMPAEKLSPGKIAQQHPGALIVADSAAGRGFASLFEGGRTAIKVTDDFVTQAWWKLLNNAALGGICALVLRELAVAQDPEVQAIILAMMAEIVEVSRAEGAMLPEDAPEKGLERVLNAAPTHWSSIAVDRREGRKLEWEVRNAVVGARGRRHGIATPLNDLVTTLLRASDPVPD